MDQLPLMSSPNRTYYHNSRSFHRDTIYYTVCPNIIHQASPHACLLLDIWKSKGCMQLKEYAKHTLLSKTSSALNCYVQRHTACFSLQKKHHRSHFFLCQYKNHLHVIRIKLYYELPRSVYCYHMCIK
jgi:hypothetical protein